MIRIIGAGEDISARKQAEEALRNSEARYRNLFENANDMIATFALEGTITSVNRGLEVVLGWSREELLGQHYRKLATPAALALADEHTRRALAGEELPSIFASEIVRKDGRVLPIEVRSRFMRDATGQPIGVQGIFRDLTERRRMEAARKASEANYRTIFAASPDFIYLTDLAGKLLDANPALLEWQGMSLAELQQRHFLDFFAGDNQEEVVRAFAALQQGHTVRGLAVRACNVRGETREFEVNATPVHDPQGGTVILSVARDITARKQAEARLHLLSRQLLETQESERRHLARELHDEIGQRLTALKINLQMLQPVPQKAVPYLQESLHIVDSTVQQIRQLSLDLRPSQLDHLGLVDTLQWYVDWQAQRTGFVMHVAISPLQPRPSPTLETACFRLVQEALTNIARHAQARQVWLTLRQHEAVLHLLVRDDGVGFDLEAARLQAAQGKGLGLLGIEERVRLLGGQFEIVTAPGKGTELRARLPLREAL